MSTLIGSPPKSKKSKRLSLCNINCKNLTHYLDVPGMYIVHISLEDRAASGPQKKKKINREKTTLPPSLQIKPTPKYTNVKHGTKIQEHTDQSQHIKHTKHTQARSERASKTPWNTSPIDEEETTGTGSIAPPKV